MNFINGFEKVAKLSEDSQNNALSSAAIGQLPFGTTLSTAFGKRPKGHSRGKEWLHRVAGSTIGGLAGAGLVHKLSKGRLTQAGAISGGLIGEMEASKHINAKYYDKSGKLKKENQKQE